MNVLNLCEFIISLDLEIFNFIVVVVFRARQSVGGSRTLGVKQEERKVRADMTGWEEL